MGLSKHTKQLKKFSNYYQKFTIKSIAEALLHNSEDRNLEKYDLEMFDKSQESKIYHENGCVWEKIVFSIVGKFNKVTMNRYKKSVMTCTPKISRKLK